MKSQKILKIAEKFRLKGKKEIPEVQKTKYKEAIWEEPDFINFCQMKKDWTPEEHNNLKTILEIPKNEFGYYVDRYHQRVSYNGIRTLKRSKTELKLSDIHLNEIEKCKNDFEYFRMHYCLITTKTGLARPEPREYQEELEQNLVTLDDCVILYPRQSGKTVTTGTYLLWRAVFHPDAINIGIVANKPPTAHEVLSKMKKIFIELPIWLQAGVSIWNKGSIEFENGTRVMTDGPSSDSFRGYTINILYTDELAYFPKNLWDEFTDSVMPTMNSLIFKQIIMTSTANGTNHFKYIVDAAKLKDSSERFITTSWRNVPHYNKQGELLSPEEYKKITIKKYGKKYFAQTEENVFLGSSDTLISGEALRDIELTVEEAEKNLIPNNVLTGLNMAKKVEKDHIYLISVDPSKDGIDDFSVSVTDITTFPFEQVAWVDLQIDYLMMPENLAALGEYYNMALIIVENNEGSGQSITDILFREYEYENLFRDKNIDGKIGFKKYTGFRQTLKSRPLILNLLKIFIEEGKFIVRSRTLLEQLYTFNKQKTGNKYEAEDGYKDDAVLCAAITFAPFMSNKTFDDHQLFVKELKLVDSNVKIVEFMSAMDIGFTNEEEEEDSRREFLEEMEDDLQDYGFDALELEGVTRGADFVR